jgi:hypothetical protein
MRGELSTSRTTTTQLITHNRHCAQQEGRIRSPDERLGDPNGSTLRAATTTARYVVYSWGTADEHVGAPLEPRAPRWEYDMIAMAALETLAQQQPPQTGLGTGGVREWILNNLIPLLLLVVALLLLWLGGGKGDNAGVMRRLGGVIVALAIIGLAVTTDAGKNIGQWIAGLFTG